MTAQPANSNFPSREAIILGLAEQIVVLEDLAESEHFVLFAPTYRNLAQKLTKICRLMERESTTPKQVLRELYDTAPERFDSFLATPLLQLKDWESSFNATMFDPAHPFHTTVSTVVTNALREERIVRFLSDNVLFGHLGLDDEESYKQGLSQLYRRHEAEPLADIIQAMVRPFPGYENPAFDDLTSGYAHPGDMPDRRRPNPIVGQATVITNPPPTIKPVLH